MNWTASSFVFNCRYANFDDRDDKCMESNFAQVMREERKSALIGKLLGG